MAADVTFDAGIKTANEFEAKIEDETVLEAEFETIERVSSGGVSSVNGKTGEVILNAHDVGAYERPENGIPKSDLSEELQVDATLAERAVRVTGWFSQFLTQGGIDPQTGEDEPWDIDPESEDPYSAVKWRTMEGTGYQFLGLVIPSEYKMSVFQYSESFFGSLVYVGYLQTDGTFGTSGEMRYGNSFIVGEGTRDYQYKFVFERVDGEPISNEFVLMEAMKEYAMQGVQSVNGSTGNVTITRESLGAERATQVFQYSSTIPTLYPSAYAFYAYANPVSQLTIRSCPDGPWGVRFRSGSTPTVFTKSDTVTNLKGLDDFVPKANKVYEINVLDGYAVWAEWDS